MLVNLGQIMKKNNPDSNAPSTPDNKGLEKEKQKPKDVNESAAEANRDISELEKQSPSNSD